MAGPALALLLARQGRRVVVFERAPQLGPVGAGILLQPTGMAMLARLGLLDAVKKAGCPVRALDARTASGRRVWHLRYEDCPEFAEGGVGIHRGALFSLLLDAAVAAGAEVKVDAEIASVSHRADGTSDVHDTLGNAYGPFSWVAITAGGRSEIAVPLSPARAVRRYRWGAWWTCLPNPQGFAPDTLAQWYRCTEELLGVLPTSPAGPGDEPARASIFMSLRTDRAVQERAGGIAALRTRMQALAPPAAPLLEGLRDFSQLMMAVYGEIHMARWSTDRVVWLGDAAHAMSPHLGQGTNLALMDAEALANAIGQHARAADAFIAYERERRAHTAFYQFVSRWMMPFFQCSAPGIGLLRDIGMPMLSAIPTTRRWMVEVLAGVRMPFGRIATGAR